MATNDYLVAGGDGYTVFGEALKSAGDYANLGGTLTSSKLAYNDPGTWLRDLVMPRSRPGKPSPPKSTAASKPWTDMRVYVNQKPVDLVPGMQVRHALIGAGQMAAIAAGLKVYDEWGHELGLDGALTDGMKIFVK